MAGGSLLSRGNIFTQSGLRCPVFAARDGARLQKQTAAPAPLRLFLPQAAPQLRSHPPTAVTPSLRLRPLAGALNRKLLPPNPCCADPGGGSPRPREPFSSIGIVSVISALQRKSRRSSFRPRAPVWGRARRAGGTLKGRRVGLDSKSKQKSSPLAGTAFISCKMENH